MFRILAKIMIVLSFLVPSAELSYALRPAATTFNINRTFDSITRGDAAGLGKVAIIGASGYLGKKVYNTFKRVVPDPNNIVGASYSKQQEELYHLDVTNEAEVKAFIETFKPDTIIYAAGLTNPELVDKDPEMAENLNANVLDLIAKYFKGHFVYISTDYVFDGKRPPYYPNDDTNPLNIYGQTKVHGEEKTISNFDKYSILRIGVLYGHNDKNDKMTFVRQIIEKIRDGEDIIKVDNIQIRHPVWIDDVAKYILILVTQSSFGIFQLNSEESVTKYEWAHIVASIYGDLLSGSAPHLSPAEIKARIVGTDSASKITTKPHNARMVNTAKPNPLTHGTTQTILSLLHITSEIDSAA